MSARRGATGLSGILPVDKPAGMTSHDVVNRLRRATGERRIGHAGTLDPMATGLLVALVGPATRLAPYLTAAQKTYLARIVFGAETDTDDAEGNLTATSPIPDEVSDPFFAAATVAALVGTHQQVPPAYSAIKREGQTAHEVARRGGEMELQPREIEVVAARLVGITIEPSVAWDVELTVSKGTYVRALARDLGRALDSAAHLGALRRTASGTLGIDRAHTLERVDTTDDIASLFFDPLQALGLPLVAVDAEDARRVAVGASLRVAGRAADGLPPGSLAAVAHEGALLGVYERTGDMLKPRTVIPGGATGRENEPR